MPFDFTAGALGANGSSSSESCERDEGLCARGPLIAGRRKIDGSPWQAMDVSRSNADILKYKAKRQRQDNESCYRRMSRVEDGR